VGIGQAKFWINTKGTIMNEVINENMPKPQWAVNLSSKI
jgi:hypothetical protein